LFAQRGVVEPATFEQCLKQGPAVADAVAVSGGVGRN